MKYVIILMLLSGIAKAKVLNKIIAAVEDSSITLEEARREVNTYTSKKSISPQIYKKRKVVLENIINLFIQRNIIRQKLKEIGFEIKNDQVESQIKSTESRLGLGRKELLEFLKSNGLSFNEYFETTRETIEFNLFLGRIIKPLIKITEQDLIKRYKKTSKGETLTFEYSLVDFYLPKNELNTLKKKNIKRDLKKFKEKGFLPEYLKNVKTNVISDVKEEGLTNEIKSALKGFQKNDFSKSIVIGNEIHTFYIKDKKLIESEIFQKQKPILKQQLFEIYSKDVIKNWIEQHKKDYYIFTNI